MRIYQWAKNTLLFVPILMAHQANNIESLISVIWAFISFSLCASSVYILNDMVDIESDKQHPTKKNRPFAMGKLTIRAGTILIVILLILSFGIAFAMLPKAFSVVLLIYFVSTTAYSVYLKQIMLVDVILLGGLYTLRVLAGSIAANVEISSWLLVFSMFFFLSLAFVKRYADLILIKKNKNSSIAGRGYKVDDLDLVQKSGITSGFVSVLVLALYINSPHVGDLYKSPVLIWFALPLLLYWLMRMWMVTNRGEMTDDPIIYALRDKASYLAMGSIVIIMILAATVDSSIFNYFNMVQ